MIRDKAPKFIANYAIHVMGTAKYNLPHEEWKEEHEELRKFTPMSAAQTMTGDTEPPSSLRRFLDGKVGDLID